jgi:hypothetical protein
VSLEYRGAGREQAIPARKAGAGRRRRGRQTRGRGGGGVRRPLPGVDVVLVLAGEELAHLGVDAVDVGGQGEDGEKNEEGEEVGGAHGRAFFLAVVRFAFCVVRSPLTVVRLVVVREIRLAGSLRVKRSSASRAAISPWSVS